MKLGAFDIALLSDGTFALDGGQMFGVVPKVLWEKRLPADARNRVRLSLTCLLVRAGKHTVIVETGIGDKYEAKFSDIYGIDHTSLLPDELKKHGVHPVRGHCGEHTSSFRPLRLERSPRRRPPCPHVSTRPLLYSARGVGACAQPDRARPRQLY